MNKVTVVMPTLLKPDKSIYEYTIKELCNNNNVEKVVILLNNKDKIIELLHPKLKVIDDKENLYVNPAWNYGLSICNTEYYLIINDDVLCHKDIIDKCIKLLNENKNYDLLFIDTKEEKLEDYKVNILKCIEDVEIKNIMYIPMHAISGCFMFGRKSTWVPIPEELKVFYGDNWIMDTNKRNTAKIMNYYVSHFTATSAREHYDTLLISEGKIYEKVMPLEVI